MKTIDRLPLTSTCNFQELEASRNTVAPGTIKKLDYTCYATCSCFEFLA